MCPQADVIGAAEPGHDEEEERGQGGRPGCLLIQRKTAENLDEDDPGDDQIAPDHHRAL